MDTDVVTGRTDGYRFPDGRDCSVTLRNRQLIPGWLQYFPEVSLINPTRYS